MWTTIATQISQATARPFVVQSQQSIAGGCINQGYAITDGSQTYFVKFNQATQIAMFEAEAAGLSAMAATQTIRVPQPVCYGIEGGRAYLVLEWLELGRGGQWAAMGKQLAKMHRTTSDRGFGWERSNTIGSTPQPNPWTADWAQFFAEHRIGYQLNLAKRRGGNFPLGDRLLAAIPALLSHQPVPALVHGDLWSGNAAFTESGEPTIFDPATYFGDREVDLAMTELFGGFPGEFYRGYETEFPLSAGYKTRKILYNLYHILNHFNLFGGGYASQADRMMQQVLAA